MLATRLGRLPREAEQQFEQFLAHAEIDEIDVAPAIDVEAVACFERFGEGPHPVRVNFTDCLSYASAKVCGARLLFKGGDFVHTDANSWV